MANQLIPSYGARVPLEQPQAMPPAYSPGPPLGGATPQTNPVVRLAGAIKRHRWWVVAFLVVGTIGGYLTSRFIKPQFEVQANIFLRGDSKKYNGVVPGQAAELVSQQGWIELLNSFEVTDQVVRRVGLFVSTDSPKDSTILRGFRIKDRMVGGDYVLKTDRSGKSWSLSRGGLDLDKGQFGDSVGAKVGFIWIPRSPGPDKNIRFSVRTPREASVELRKVFKATIPPFTNFIRITYAADNGELAATTLNRWLEEFTTVASRLKTRNVVDFANVLETQVQTAQQRLRDAEIALESFKVKTITEPTEAGVTPGAGIAVPGQGDPGMSSFFQQKFQFESVKRDREQLEQLITDSRTGATPGVITAEALIALPSVVQGSPALKVALDELTAAQAKLRTLRSSYSDDFPAVRQAADQVKQLQTQTIPQAALAMLDQLRRKEEQMKGTLSGAESELKKIPARSIEEMRLRRDVEVTNQLYTALLGRYNEVRMSSENTDADVSVIDTAVAPLEPTKSTTSVILAGGVVGGLALGILVAFLLDRFDRRFRYPEQATHELGLDIIGFVPTLKLTRRGERDPVATAQVVEAFRTLRLSLQHLTPPGEPVTLTVTSPMSGDGKSLIASNLAVSFAEAGLRTLLIDGDVRRGALHSAFSVPQVPGMVDVLAGRATLFDALRPEVQPNLALIPCGTRTARAPEMLNSPLEQMFRALKPQYDVIIIDSPPLGAGADALALGICSGHVAVVLRTGETDRKMAEAKLRVLDKLPITVFGAILNDVTAEGEYAYYSYLSEYYQEDRDDEPPPPAREMTEEMRMSQHGTVRPDFVDEVPE